MNIKQKFTKFQLVLVVFLLTAITQAQLFAEDTKEKQFVNITAVEASALIQKNLENTDFKIIDVRTPDEFNAGHISNSQMIDYYADDFLTRLNELDKNKTYLIYCRSGNRSGKTIPMMKKLGFKKVYNMLGGVKSWVSYPLPLVQD